MPSNAAHPLLDQDGHLLDSKLWNLELAEQLAAPLAITLTHQHLAIISAMRQFYLQYAYAPNTRPMVKYLQSHVQPGLTSNQLMQLFNTGRIAREICRIAGLPKPPNCL